MSLNPAGIAPSANRRLPSPSVMGKIFRRNSSIRSFFRASRSLHDTIECHEGKDRKFPRPRSPPSDSTLFPCSASKKGGDRQSLQVLPDPTESRRQTIL